MCGICGAISKDRLTQADAAEVSTMNAALLHRGPDSEGSFREDQVIGSMRRLAIIDVAGGNQPLYNEDKTLMLIANGEIYNFVELRDEFIGKGHTFSTKSDCETLLHAYEAYGDEFLNRVRGMFAFCLYDKRKNRVLVVRDRLGEKPLYLHETDSHIFFSSELKSLARVIPASERQIDRESAYLYFKYGYVPEPRSILRGVRRLGPGRVLTIDLNTGNKTERSYWDPEASVQPVDSPTETIRAQLNEIEKICIRSDVPVGISLSGGIDSSIVAALAARFTNSPLHAFSVGYKGRPQNDERTVAQKLAETLGFTFHDIELDNDSFARDFESVMSALDEPIADIAAYGYWAVARLAAHKGVKVLLAGFGGDEWFWGYPWTRDAARFNRLKQTFFGKCALAGILIKRYWRDIARRPLVMLSAIREDIISPKLLLYELSPYVHFVRKNGDRIFDKAFLNSINHGNVEKKGDAVNTESIGISITKQLKDLWLISNCINLGDRMSMTHSVELRLPLVDYKLYETALGIRKAYPTDDLLGHKHWLIEAVRDLLPADIFNRRKRGFTPPTIQWSLEAIERHQDLLKKGYLVRNKIIQSAFFEEALGDREQRKRNLRFLYAALVFELTVRNLLS